MFVTQERAIARPKPTERNNALAHTRFECAGKPVTCLDRICDETTLSSGISPCCCFSRDTCAGMQFSPSQRDKSSERSAVGFHHLSVLETHTGHRSQTTESTSHSYRQWGHRRVTTLKLDEHLLGTFVSRKVYCRSDSISDWKNFVSLQSVTHNDLINLPMWIRNPAYSPKNPRSLRMFIAVLIVPFC